MMVFLKFFLFILMCFTKSTAALDVENIANEKRDNEYIAPCFKSSGGDLGVPNNSERRGWSVFIDQDFLAVNPGNPEADDHNYTMGFGMSNSGMSNSEGVFANSRGWLDEKILGDTDNSYKILESMHTTSYGMAIYTPDDLENKSVIEGDRPYASLMYMSNTKMNAYINGESIETTFMIGVLGLDVAKEMQRYIHNDLNASNEDPLGWGNQISDGGEITALYSVEKITLISSCYVENKASSDISYSVSADLGYMINAAIGVDLRWGYIATPYYLHSKAPVSNYSYYSCYGCSVLDNYLFLNFKVRAIAYNALLQGQFRDSKWTIDSEDIENVVLEASLGWVYSLSPEWKITYSINFKSREFKGSEVEDQLYGGLYLSKGFLE